MDIADELRLLISRLDEHGIDYALCGGLAMSVYGKPRSTIDIDMLTLPESLDAALVIAKSIGYNIRGKDLSFKNGAVEIRRVSKVDPVDGELLSLDLLLVTPEIQSIWDSRLRADWEGTKLGVVSREGLIALKELRRSGQDLDDLKHLTEESPDEER